MSKQAQADGSVVINTKIDTQGMEQGMEKVGKGADKAKEKMESLVKTLQKIGKTIATVFAVKQIVNFAKEAVKAAEVQEEMEQKLETVMRQRMGATEDMIQSVKDLTAEQQKLGVVGDEVQMSGAQQLATFLRTSDALKTLIPAMNNLAVQQNGVNVSASAMANIGNLMGKVMQGQVSALTRVGITFSKAEEKILKYGTEQQKAATLAKVITNNVGNMNEALAATPAGKIRQIKNNFGDMMETLGTGIQNILTPFLGVINRIVEALQRAANAFKAFTVMITGKDSSAAGGASGGVIGDTAVDMDALAEAEEKEAKAKKKQNKEQKKYLSGLDEIRRYELDKDDDEDEDEEDAPVPSTAPATTKETTSALDGLLKKLKELADLFKKGFWDGLGDYKPRLDEIKKDFEAIKKHLKDIWTDPEVQRAFNNFLNTMAYSLGQIVGSMASMGLTMAQLLVGGFEDFLNKSKDRIKQHLVTLFDVGAEIWAMAGEFAKAIAYIFEAFGGQNAQAALGSLISIVYEVGAVVGELALKFARDILKIITDPIIQNADKIKSAIDGTLGVVMIALDGLLTAVRNVADAARSIYDDHIRPFLNDIAATVTKVVGIIVDGYNQHVLPVLEKLAERFKGIMEGPFANYINSVKRLIGVLIDRLHEFWNDTLDPLFTWIATHIMPLLAKIINTIGTGLLDALEWLLEKLTDFTDWCADNPEVIENMAIVIGSFFAAWQITKIVGGIATMLQSIGTLISTIKLCGGVFGILKTALGGLVTMLGGPVTIAIAAVIAAGILLYKNWDTVCEWAGKLKEKVVTIWNTIKATIATIIDIIIGKVSAMKSSIASKFEEIKAGAIEKFNALKSKVSEIWNSIKATAAEIWANIKTAISTKITEIKTTVTTKVNEIKSSIKNAWDNIKTTSTNAWSSVKSTAVSKWNSIKSTITEKVGAIKTNVINAWADIKKDLGEKFENIKTNAEGLGKKLIDIKDNYFAKVADYLKNEFSEGFENIKNIGKSIVDYFTGDFLSSWGEAWTGIVDKVKSVFGGLADIVKEPINAAIDKVNEAISWINDKLGGIWDAVSIPSFEIGGFNIGPVQFPGYTFPGFGLRSFSNPPQISSIPRLAQGTVIPPNAPFLATLGDQKHGTNIEAPLETIKQAVREVNGSKGNTYRVSAEVGGRTILEIVLDEARMMQMQTGRNVFEM